MPAPAPHEARTAPSGRPLSEVKFLTVAEVASLMEVSKMTVYRMVHSGHLPAIRVGRSFRVPEQAVHEYLREAYVKEGIS
ncbi:helix-turn-helix domain-containing protein [Streptomyces sp. NPDC089922]|uniref:helix-turn-helix domain-containing protein n=1 Tax=unclassified Streptomyces TaxID=2593676 RepID=UPI003436602C